MDGGKGQVVLLFLVRFSFKKEKCRGGKTMTLLKGKLLVSGYLPVNSPTRFAGNFHLKWDTYNLIIVNNRNNEQ